jgi:fucose permease
VRYTGASLTFNLAGIFGGSLAPYIATYLAATAGIAYVGYYLSAAAALTLLAQLLLQRREQRARTADQGGERANSPAA